MKKFFFLFCIGFFLNLVWENAQAPLYDGYENFWQHFSTCLRGAIGDAVIIIAFYFFLLFIRFRHPIFILMTGATLGIGIEHIGLSLGRWSYDPSMPIIPFFSVGLFPVLQMALLPLLTFFLFSRQKGAMIR